MVKSVYCVSPQKYLEMVTGKVFVVAGDDDCGFIDRKLEEEGFSELWSYPLTEPEQVASLDSDVILVDCMYLAKDGEYQHMLRWFELPEKKNKRIERVYKELDKKLSEYEESMLLL